MNFKKYISVIVILIISINLFAQNTTKRSSNSDTLKSNVVVVRAYDPTVSDAQKLTFSPDIKDSSEVNVDFNYYINAQKADAEFEVMPINAARVLPEPLKKLYNSNLKAGFGNHTTPLVEYSYNSLRSKTNNVAIHLKHYSSAAKLKLNNDYEEKVFAGFSENIAEISSKLFVKRTSLVKLGVNFNRNVFHNYGFNVDSLPTDITELPAQEDYRQRYWSVGANMNYLSNNISKHKLNYNAGLVYNYLENLQKGNQHTIEFDGRFSKYHKKELIGIDVFVGTYANKHDTAVNSRVNIALKPYVKVGNKKWLVKAGLDIVADTYKEQVGYHFYPNIDFHYNIIEHFLTPYIGVNGKKQVNDYRSVILENPYVTNNLVVQNSNHRVVGFAGLKGIMSKCLSYNFSAKYSIIDDMYFFVNDTTANYDNTFIVEQDNVEITTLAGEIMWSKSKKLSFILKGEYFQYKMDSLLKPWHKPDMEITFTTKYNLRDKIIINFDVFGTNERFAKDLYNPEAPIKLNPIVDVNLGIEYRYNKLISAFVQFNNIAATKYYKWNQYPTLGFHAMFGLSYSF